jgi:dihydrofolate reductase
MSLSIIMAISKNGCIGYENKLPWTIPSDLRRFKYLTQKHIVVMGRKTFESLPKLLSKRVHYVMTRDIHLLYEFISTFPNVFYAGNKQNILEHAQHNFPGKHIFVIGGADIFPLFYDDVDYMHITYIDKKYDGDTYIDMTLLNEALTSFNTKVRVDTYDYPAPVHYVLYKRNTCKEDVRFNIVY